MFQNNFLNICKRMPSDQHQKYLVIFSSASHDLVSLCHNLASIVVVNFLIHEFSLLKLLSKATIFTAWRVRWPRLSSYMEMQVLSIILKSNKKEKFWQEQKCWEWWDLHLVNQHQNCRMTSCGNYYPCRIFSFFFCSFLRVYRH